MEFEEKKKDIQEEQKKLSVEKLKEPARIEFAKAEDEKFFAYEKQRSHH